MPKLWVDVPMMACKISHLTACDDFESKWNYRLLGKEEYHKRELVKNIDSNNKVVYDNWERSPFYTDTSNPYFNEKKLLPAKDIDSTSSQKFKPRGYRRPLISTGIPKKDKIYSFLNPYYKIESEEDTTLVFESRFEWGNLKRVTKVDEYEYDLIVNSDYNSQGYSQWFYFLWSNTRCGNKYTFNIYNFYKPDSLYNQGMKPLMYSEKKAESDGIGWKRWGDNVWYYQNTVKRKSGAGFYYSLSFSFEFPFDDDEVYLAQCYPYSYRDCKSHLEYICTDNKEEGRINMKERIRKTELWKSLAENSLDLVIITNFESSDLDIAKREAVVITSRVHPGETNASFIVEGILDFLVSDESEAQQLREKYVFKIVPMLNPDGVVVGNYRWSLSGQDLNRQWIGATSRVFPEIYFTKQMLKKTQESRKIFLFTDIHGHSRKRNCFMYGWNNKNTSDKKNHEKIFPLRFSQNHCSFSFEDCNFNMQKDKESTGRVVVRREYNVINSFTLEASLFGPDKGTYRDWHFTPNQLKHIGKTFWLSLNDMDDTKSKASLLKQLESSSLIFKD